MAVNFSDVPLAMLGLAGVTAIDTSTAEVTVRTVVPEMLPDVALIVVVPAVAAVAFPPVAMVETDALDELHVTKAVMSLVLVSEKVPVAVNCWVVPAAMLGFAGVTAIDTSEGGGGE